MQKPKEEEKHQSHKANIEHMVSKSNVEDDELDDFGLDEFD
jgi:hypothetical protein